MLEPECLTLEELLSECAHEIQQYRACHSSIDACRLELFRRAICCRDQQAWQAIYFLYNQLICSWVCRFARGASWLNEDEAASLANVAFAKLARHLTAEKLADFASIGALLKYFKVIVGCVVADEQASRDRWEETAGLLTRLDYGVEDLATIVVANDEAKSLLRGIFSCLKTERERSYIIQAYVYGMRPQHIVAASRELFPTVSDVYRTHANIRNKLRGYYRRRMGVRGKK